MWALRDSNSPTVSPVRQFLSGRVYNPLPLSTHFLQLTYLKELALVVGFEPTVEVNFTRLTAWTVRPTTATPEYVFVGVDGLEPSNSKRADLQSVAIATMRYSHFQRLFKTKKASHF